MKPLRVWLLLIFALLVPIRGALALAVCGQNAAHTRSALHVTAQSAETMCHPLVDDAQVGHAAHHAMPHHDPATGGEVDSSGPDACFLCAMGCHSFAPWHAATLAAAPEPGAAMRSVMAPAYLPMVHLAGPERPPRTI